MWPAPSRHCEPCGREPAKTAAQRQAERKARELAAGRVQWRRWVHPDDVPALAEYADKLARKRARAEQKAG
jgi:ribonuclease HI